METTTRAHSMGTAGPLPIFTTADLERIDAAALGVLAETGVSLPSARARAGLVARGAAVEGARVRLRPDLVRELVALAPPQLTLGARAGVSLVTGERSLITTDGCCVEIYDLWSGEKRDTTAADVIPAAPTDSAPTDSVEAPEVDDSQAASEGDGDAVEPVDAAPAVVDEAPAG